MLECYVEYCEKNEVAEPGGSLTNDRGIIMVSVLQETLDLIVGKSDDYIPLRTALIELVHRLSREDLEYFCRNHPLKGAELYLAYQRERLKRDFLGFGFQQFAIEEIARLRAQPKPETTM